ncbi:DeoR/GlpR family DNA-binding transcription regulator [Jiella sp. MQZ9-1]|uniref:DeoR/GlpR transcriptional regulator n=1 Tax=Jiella flava TaxID=2816857 RepID=A0A939FV81_9HYPH|nr:DeoR/GlpR family DNA-binding transcription regulator [Jiella flava]MBO0662573.1 DeoR/GlpR transcriptional regulator [Jiella flava]MCD2472944.1 DeoR/GlpR family DNA-binding transcription regulator [Jiella flava]
MRVSKSNRQSQILAELNVSPSLRIAELAERLNVSTETIRRDLDELNRQGQLSRTYGGAIRALGTEPSVAERHALLVPERERIARRAMPLLASANVIMIGSGSTTVHVARRLAVERTNITVITHSFGVATVLALNPTISTLIAPGAYHGTEGATVGVHTVSFLDTFFADAAVLGASGLTEEGPTDALLDAGAVYSAMLARSARSVVVADHSKFDRVFPARYGAWKQIDALVSDTAPAGQLKAAMDRHRVTVAVG